MNDAIGLPLVIQYFRDSTEISRAVCVASFHLSNGKMRILLVVLLFLASFQLSDGVICVTNALFPCKCTLSNGGSGVIDISPLFSQGNLTTVDNGHFKYYYDPCNGVDCSSHCNSGTCAICQVGLKDEREQFGLGSMNTAQYTVTNYDPSAKYFSMSVIYSMGAGGRQTVVNFVYNQTAHSPDFVWDNEIPDNHYRFHVVTNGPGVQISSSTEPPQGNTSGPYPIQKDACTGWSGDKSILASSGLLKLSAQASNLNYTWTKDEYTFDYYVGVCVVPVSTSLSNCYVVQKTTTSDGEITFQCLGEDLDVQVTNTQNQGWLLLSYAFSDPEAFQCDTSVRRTKIFFFCSRGAGSGTPLFVVQNPLQDECFYQFNWPTDILCGPVNNTQPSPAVHQSPISLESAVLIGIGGATFLLLLVLISSFTIAVCCLCRSKPSNSVVVSKYRRMNEPTHLQEERD